ncbi:Trp biosynthesis-associated membrane protein, partial [Actinocorallia lasiicapitis]
ALPERARALAEAGQPAEVTTTSWWIAACAGGLLLAACGVWTAVRSGCWPGMSARYDRADKPVKAVAADDPSSLWKSLDRGEDPTAGTGEGTLRTPEREL